MRSIATITSLALAAAALAVPAAAARARPADRREGAALSRPALAAGIIVRTRAGAGTSALRATVADAVPGRVDRVAIGARGDKGKVQVTLERLAKPGKHKIRARYSGTSGVAASRSRKRSSGSSRADGPPADPG